MLTSFLADTPFGQVKIGELGAWFGRRQKNPRALAGLFSRAWWRWQHKYMLPKKASIAPFFQLTLAACTFFYIINYGKISKYSIQKLPTFNNQSFYNLKFNVNLCNLQLRSMNFHSKLCIVGQ